MTVKPIPDGYHSVTPFVICSDAARFLDFMRVAFGAEELGRVVGDDGRIGHAEARIGDSVVMAFDGKPEWPHTPGSFGSMSRTATTPCAEPWTPAAAP